jgi:hypothetical protein
MSAIEKPELRVEVRLAFTVTEAAIVLGVSPDFFATHIAADLRVVRRGRLVLVPVVELERWLGREAALTLQNHRAGTATRPVRRLGGWETREG